VHCFDKVAHLNKTALVFSLMGLLATCPPGLRAEPGAFEAERAVYSLPSNAVAYSFSDLFRLSLEAEAGLAPNLSLPDPSGTAGMVLPVGLVEPGAPLGAGPVVASQKASRLRDAPVVRSWDLPRPSAWLTALSVFAVIGFIAWRRSEGVD
jgi:hypothetical protein